MKLTLSQWVAWFALDLLIKTTAVTLFGMLVTLGAAPIAVFIKLGIFLSGVHFSLCVRGSRCYGIEQIALSEIDRCSGLDNHLLRCAYNFSVSLRCVVRKFVS